MTDDAPRHRVLRRSQPGKAASQAGADASQLHVRTFFDELWIAALVRRGVVDVDTLGPAMREALAPELERMADPSASDAIIATRVALKALARKWALA